MSSSAPTMYGVPTYLEAQLWKARLMLDAARDFENALWLEGFLVGLFVALVLVGSIFLRERWARRATGADL